MTRAVGTGMDTSWIGQASCWILTAQYQQPPCRPLGSGLQPWRSIIWRLIALGFAPPCLKPPPPPPLPWGRGSPQLSSLQSMTNSHGLAISGAWPCLAVTMCPTSRLVHFFMVVWGPHFSIAPITAILSNPTVGNSRLASFCTLLDAVGLHARV